MDFIWNIVSTYYVNENGIRRHTDTDTAHRENVEEGDVLIAYKLVT